MTHTTLTTSIQVFAFKSYYKGVEMIKMPKNAKILTVKIQDDIMVIYAEVVILAHKEFEFRQFMKCYTGEEIPINPPIERRYLGTTQRYGGSLVVHVYEINI